MFGAQKQSKKISHPRSTLLPCRSSNIEPPPIFSDHNSKVSSWALWREDALVQRPPPSPWLGSSMLSCWTRKSLILKLLPWLYSIDLAFVLKPKHVEEFFSWKGLILYLIPTWQGILIDLRSMIVHYYHPHQRRNRRPPVNFSSLSPFIL